MSTAAEDPDASYVMTDDDEDTEEESGASEEDTTTEDEDMETEDEGKDDDSAVPDGPENASADQAASSKPSAQSTSASSRKLVHGKRNLAAANKKSQKKRKGQTYDKAIFNVFRCIYPFNGLQKHSISVDAMEIMNGFMNQVFELLVCEAAKLAKHNKKKTIGTREIRTATQLVLSGELAKHALREGDNSMKRLAMS